jgi:hypothetical protein
MAANETWDSLNIFTSAAAVSPNRGGSTTVGCSGQLIWTIAGMALGAGC